MSLRTVARLACAAAVLLAPAAHASQVDQRCARLYGSAVPAGARGWHCAGTGPQQPGCYNVAVNDPSTGYPLAGVEICGLV
jgi:hypothetical protein